MSGQFTTTICRNNKKFFQGKVMQHDQKGGIIISSSDLALQGITKGQSGNYSCIASNVEGDGESNTVSLKIMCEYFQNFFG